MHEGGANGRERFFQASNSDNQEETKSTKNLTPSTATPDGGSTPYRQIPDIDSENKPERSLSELADLSSTPEARETKLDDARARKLGMATLRAFESDSENEYSHEAPLDPDEVSWAIRFIEHHISVVRNQSLKPREPGIVTAEEETRRADTVSLSIITNFLQGGHVFSAEQRLEGEPITEFLTRAISSYETSLKDKYSNSPVTKHMPAEGPIQLSGFTGPRFATEPAIIVKRRLAEQFYEAGRARQIIEKLETMPERVRETILEGYDADPSWLYTDPVVFSVTKN